MTRSLDPFQSHDKASPSLHCANRHAGRDRMYANVSYADRRVLLLSKIISSAISMPSAFVSQQVNLVLADRTGT